MNRRDMTVAIARIQVAEDNGDFTPAEADRLRADIEQAYVLHCDFVRLRNASPRNYQPGGMHVATLPAYVVHVITEETMMLTRIVTDRHRNRLFLCDGRLFESDEIRIVSKAEWLNLRNESLIMS